MTGSNSDVKQQLIKALREDEEFRYAIIGILAEGVITKTEMKLVIEEIKGLREDFNKGFEEHSKEIAELRRETNELRRELVTLREDFNRRFEEHSKEIAELWAEIKNLREDMQSGFKLMEEGFRVMEKRVNALHGLISVIGGRWGIRAEAAFREAMLELIRDIVGWDVKKLKMYDDQGVVYGVPSEVEVDLAIRNGVHILVEVKARVQKSDVAELLRIGEFYEKREGVKPRLIIVSPTVDRRAYEFATENGVEVYTYPEESV